MGDQLGEAIWAQRLPANDLPISYEPSPCQHLLSYLAKSFRLRHRLFVRLMVLLVGRKGNEVLIYSSRIYMCSLTEKNAEVNFLVRDRQRSK